MRGENSDISARRIKIAEIGRSKNVAKEPPESTSERLKLLSAILPNISPKIMGGMEKSSLSRK